MFLLRNRINFTYCSIVFSIFILITYYLDAYYFHRLYLEPLQLELTQFDGSRLKFDDLILSETCEKVLNQFSSFKNLSVPAILIDLKFLSDLKKGKCQQGPGKLQIAVDEKYKFFPISSFSRFFFFKSTNPKDFIQFLDNRTILKDFETVFISRNLQIPSNIPQFQEFWKKSTLVKSDKKSTWRQREEKSTWQKYIPFLTTPTQHRYPLSQKSANQLAKLRNEMLKFGMFPFLIGQTLLDWYQDGSASPTLTIGVLAENWNPDFYDYLWSFVSEFSVIKQVGLIDDSFEITVVPRGLRSKISITLSLIYKNDDDDNDERWLGTVKRGGEKLKSMHSNIEAWCSADLRGHLFWVPCEMTTIRNYTKWSWIENGRFTQSNADQEFKFYENRTKFETDQRTL